MNAQDLVKIIELLNGTDEKPENEGINIVILQRGWVVVGDLSWSGKWGILENASVIRVWGTSNGLGEIAENGPTDKTRLDKCNYPIKFHELTSVAILKCNDNNWK